MAEVSMRSMSVCDEDDGESDDDDPSNKKHAASRVTLVNSSKTALLLGEQSNPMARLLTFQNHTLELSATSLSIAGFFKSRFQEDHDVLECNWCHLKLTNFSSSDNPLVWHKVFSKRCPFVKSYNPKKQNYFFTSSGYNQLIEKSNSVRNSPQRETSLASDGNSPAVPNITLTRNDNVSEDDNDADDGSRTPEEITKSYIQLNELRLVLPEAHIDAIRKPSAKIKQLVSTRTYERHRRLTFNNWPKSDTASPRVLAASGFIYLQDSKDTVQCVFCGVRISDWTSETLPDVVHLEKSKHCHLLKGSTLIKNIPDFLADIFEDEKNSLLSVSSEMGINTEPTKHPEFAVEARRKATFLTWPTVNHKLASEMIEHALFYTGRGDVVCCFSCGIEMSGWSSIDNIWIRHARQAPHCQLVTQEKGADWVAATIEEHGPYQEEEREERITTVTTRMLRPRMDNPATQQVLALKNPSYPREEVRSCLIQNIKFGHSDFMNRKDLVTAILKKREIKWKSEKAENSTVSNSVHPEVVAFPHISRTPQLEEASDLQSLAIQSNGLPDVPFEAAAANHAPNSNTAMEVNLTYENDLQKSSELTPGTNLKDLAKIMLAQLTCKICMDAPVGIAFLPCGHMVCCPSCAPAMVQCPLCRQDVRGTVRVYLDKL